MLENFISNIDAFNQRITKGMGVLATIALIVMLSIVVVNVLLRYGLNHSLHWAEEMPRYLMVWMTFLFFPLGHKLHMNVAVDFAVSWFKDSSPGRLLHLVLEIIVFAILLFLAKLTWQMAMNAGNIEGFDVAKFLDYSFLQQNSTTSNALSLPMCYVYMVMPVSFVATGLCSFENILRLLQKLILNAPAEPAAAPEHGC